LHAERQARGEEAYQGKLLEARQNDYKDEFVLVIISAPIIVLMWAVMSDDPAAMEKVMSENSSELINEYKEQIRILRQEVAELQDAGKSKDAANKRCLQKLEHTNQDLEQANEQIKKLEEKNDPKNKRKDKESLE